MISLSTANKINIVGIGHKPLDAGASEVVLGAEVVIASKRLSEVFAGYPEFESVRDRLQVLNKVDEVINFMKSEVQNPKSEIKSIVFLASGDPLFFGIGRRVINEFGADSVEIFPDLSSIQVAFSRIKQTWDNALLVSVHGGPDPDKRRDLKYDIKDIPLLLGKHSKVAILTDKINSPSAIAKEFLKPSSLIPHTSSFKIYVCEKLGYPDERITQGTPEDIAGMLFSDPNVVIIKNLSLQASFLSPQPSPFGLREDEITHSRGLITKDEARAVTLHKLRLPQKGVFWDIGAGSGSVSIEASLLCPDLRIFAVEKDNEQAGHLQENRLRFSAINIELIKAEAPEALSLLPLPDRVFIGGSNGMLGGIMEVISGHDRTRIVVVNATTIETLNEAVVQLEKHGFGVDISEVSVARSKKVAGRRHLSALNPVFIVRGEKD